MGEETIPLDFNSLSERITAQTEAYEKFSAALVRILEMLDNVEDAQALSTNTLTELLKSVVSTGEQLRHHMQSAKDSDREIISQLGDVRRLAHEFNTELTLQTEHVDELLSATRVLTRKIEDGERTYTENAQEIMSRLVSVDAMSLTTSKVTFDTNKLIEENVRLMKEREAQNGLMATQVGSLFDSDKSLKAAKMKLRIVFGVIGGIVTTLGMLEQFGVIHFLNIFSKPMP